MSLPKQKSREIVFQLLYCHDLNCLDSDIDKLISFVMSENKISKKNALSCFNVFEKVKKKLESLDPYIISETSSDYAFDRISSVEKNILRLALYEFFNEETIPEKVSIAEGIRLAKKYSTPHSVKFVNAVLDTIYKKGIELANQASG